MEKGTAFLQPQPDWSLTVQSGAPSWGSGGWAMIKTLLSAGILGVLLLGGIHTLVAGLLALGLVGAILRLLVRGPMAC